MQPTPPTLHSYRATHANMPPTLVRYARRHATHASTLPM